MDDDERVESREPGLAEIADWGPAEDWSEWRDAAPSETEALVVIRSTSGICADYPDWPEWLRDVRGKRDE